MGNIFMQDNFAKNNQNGISNKKLANKKLQKMPGKLLSHLLL